jgi:hypothetical protein
MPSQSVPTLYEWLGGMDALLRLTTRFYQHVKGDALLGPVFAHMGADHPSHVAAFLAEVLGGPDTYSREHSQARQSMHMRQCPSGAGVKSRALTQAKRVEPDATASNVWRIVVFRGMRFACLNTWEQSGLQTLSPMGCSTYTSRPTTLLEEKCELSEFLSFSAVCS